MVAVVAQKLRKTYDRNDDAVASIFIGPNMPWNETSRVEVLLSVLRQLHGRDANATPLVPGMPPSIEQTSQPNATTPPIENIHEELKVQLKRLNRAFLLVDGIDRCGWFTNTSLEFDIQRLQRLGLKVLLTSRTLAFEQEDWENEDNDCDSCGDDASQVYWSCESGLHPQAYIICQDCHVKLKSCPYPSCRSMDSYIQPYDKRRIEMDEIVDGKLRDYVTWNLENEHGNLGFGNDLTPKPPLSMLGARIRDSRRPNASLWLQNEILKLSGGNLSGGNPSLARLGLDIANETILAVDNIDASPGQLPVAVTSLFEAGIRGIQEQGSPNAEIGLKALALWKLGYNTEEILLKKLEAASIPADQCTMERVLHATRGFLQQKLLNADRRIIKEYTTSFHIHVWGGYSDIINSVVEKLLAGSIRKNSFNRIG
ncbi:hypothetical protein G7054_g15202 [Neopestalotiopsis clavispora]|nr:hypothetical protein G7054_g15202 [Neopestalotiopsis clavispora]